ncbi:MAG: hypothetical protein JWO97_480 [Acidobacteria bacterium]|nr:hypothetical protein [Acidobacteriota bacterium]
MKRFALALAALCLLQVCVLSVGAAETPKECTLCVGAAGLPASTTAVAVPLFVRTSQDELPTVATSIDALTPAQRKLITLVVDYRVGQDHEPLAEVEEHTKAIVEWARLHGPFDAIGVAVADADAATLGYAIKRLAVTAQGLNVAARIVSAPMPLDAMAKLYETGAQAYFDAVVTDAPSAAAKWLLEKDPAKKIYAVVTPSAPNVIYDAARALADGATRAYVSGATSPDELASLANANRALAGDYAYDSTARVEVLDAKGNKVEMPVLTFIRGEDLMTLVVPRGDATLTTIASLGSDDFARPRRIDAAGDLPITDNGRKAGRFLIGVQPAKKPFVIAVEHQEKPEVQKEAISVNTKRGITVEEIIRNHQVYKSYEESIQPRYIARNTTNLRFTVNGGESLEATIAGDFFSEPGGRSDWVWSEFFINGVRWKYGRIPELPLIQPEKVTQLPLDIHLTNEYRYELVRETDVAGYHTYEVRFSPPPNAPDALPLYRGTVWIDTRTWARIRLTMVQLNLSGEILSNEERVDFQPFARASNTLLSANDVAKADPREIVWLPREVAAQQIVSATGRASVVLRATTFSDFRISPADFAERLTQASASDSRMVRETEAGLRYLEKRGNGERVVKEGFDSARTFMLGGIHHDGGLDYPVVPLGGIDYFNFNLLNKGIQTNVFFAGVIVSASAAHPNVANTRTNLGADFFGIAVPFTNSLYRNGNEQVGEAVKTLPLGLTLRAGHPILTFGKIDFSLGLSHLTYQRAEDTAPGFVVPSDTFILSPSLDLHYSRWGYTLSGTYEYARRSKWEPWGNLAEYDPNQKSYTRFGATIGKSFYLPKFQRISAELNYLDGSRLDRFSKYELGFFGAQRIHGIRSGSVRAEKALLAHLSYGFVFSQQFRLEAFYDQGLIDDKIAGYAREPFQGIGLGGQTVGPYGTILRLDLGKTIGRNAQDGFIANVVFLKLF